MFSSPATKRLRENSFDADSVGSSPLKRLQQHQIHSDAHNATVAMMMRALRQQSPSEEIVEEAVEEAAPTQKPYWPVITRVRHPDP